MCLFNPKKRCARGCNIAVKQSEEQRLEAPCLAQVKVALFTSLTCDADSSPPSWPPGPVAADLAHIVVEVRLCFCRKGIHDRCKSISLPMARTESVLTAVL